VDRQALALPSAEASV